MKLALLVLVASSALAACTSPANDDSGTTSEADTVCASMTTYGSALLSAKKTLQAAYDAAQAELGAEVKEAAAERDAKLAALAEGDRTSALYDQIIVDYEEEVGPYGPLVEAYGVACKAAADAYDATVAAALEAYEADPCR